MEIELTKGMTTVVDEEDSDLAELNWYFANTGYASRTLGLRPFRKEILLHRVILERVLGRELSRNELVDHKDTDKLNNHRTNLRLATDSQNKMNTVAHSDNISGFKGVTWVKANNKWKARIQIGGVSTQIGTFDSPEEASAAYEAKAKEVFGEFYRES